MKDKLWFADGQPREKSFSLAALFAVLSGLEISARPLANASVKPVGRVEISGYSPGLASRIFIFRKIKL